jgi:hypothetical protein
MFDGLLPIVVFIDMDRDVTVEDVNEEGFIL